MAGVQGLIWLFVLLLRLQVMGGCCDILSFILKRVSLSYFLGFSSAPVACIEEVKVQNEQAPKNDLKRVFLRKIAIM